MADGPAIQAAGLRALKTGQTLRKTLDMAAEFRADRRRDADRADGLLQPDLHLRRRAFPRRRETGRDRRADRRRPAAGDGRGTVHSGAEGRDQFHPPRHADHRRQAPAQGAREHVGLRLLRVDDRHHRLGAGRYRQGGDGGEAHQGPYRLPVCVGFGVKTAEQARRHRRLGRRRRGRHGDRQRHRQCAWAKGRKRFDRRSGRSRRDAGQRPGRRACAPPALPPPNSFPYLSQTRGSKECRP
jgi:hypothetical protein